MISCCKRYWLITCFLGLISPVSNAQNFTGAMIGNVSGYVTDDQGNQVPPEAAVEAQVSVVVDGDGNVSATISGSASCTQGLGVYVTYDVTYDATSGELTGSWTDLAGNQRSVTFTNYGDNTWTAELNGDAAAADGSRPYSLTVEINLPLNALYAGSQLPAENTFSGSLDSTETLIVPIVIDALDVNTEISVTIIISGTWEVVVVPTDDGGFTLTGSASGTFALAEPVTASVDTNLPGLASSLDIALDISGSFGGTLFGSDLENLTFAGNWVSSNGYGGDIVIGVPLDDGVPQTLPFIMTGSSFMEFALPVGDNIETTLPIYVSSVLNLSTD